MKKRQIIVWLFVMFSMHLVAGNARVIENFDFGWLFARYGLQPDAAWVCCRLSHYVLSEEVGYLASKS